MADFYNPWTTATHHFGGSGEREGSNWDTPVEQWKPLPEGWKYGYGNVSGVPADLVGPNGQQYQFYPYGPENNPYQSITGTPIQLDNGRYVIPYDKAVQYAQYVNQSDPISTFFDAGGGVLLGMGALGAIGPLAGLTGAAGAADTWPELAGPGSGLGAYEGVYSGPWAAGAEAAAGGLPTYTPPLGELNTGAGAGTENWPELAGPGSGLGPYEGVYSGPWAGGPEAAAGGAGAAAGAGSALSRILGGTASAADWISALGTLGSTALGYMGGQAQTNAYKDVAGQYMGLGAPYRSLLEASYKPGFTLANEPGYQQALDTSTNAFLRSSAAGNAPGVSSGNPFDNPGAWAETLKYVTGNTALPYLQNYRNTLAGAGQLGVAASAPAALGGAATTGGTYNALGYGLDQLTGNAQPQYLQDLTKALSGLYSMNTNRSGLV